MIYIKSTKFIYFFDHEMDFIRIINPVNYYLASHFMLCGVKFTFKIYKMIRLIC